MTFSLLVQLYAWLLRFYPSSFYDEFAEEMMAVFAQRIADAEHINQRYLLLLLLCLAELRDFPLSLLREHWYYMSQMEPNLMIPIKKPEWFFIPAWIILTTICVPIAFFLYFVAIRVIMIFVGDYIYVDGVRHITEDYLFPYVFIPIVGLLTGLLQYALLRRYLPRISWWVLATAVGWFLGPILIISSFQALSYFWEIDVFYESWSTNLAFIVMGLTIGLGQWLLLRNRLSYSGWWVCANVAGWGVFRLIVGNDALNQYELLALAIFPACITAVTFVLLAEQPTPPAPNTEA